MFEIDFNQAPNPYELHEMVRMFLPSGSYTTTDPQWNWPELLENVPVSEIVRVRIPDEIQDKNQGKQYLYKTLSELTGKVPDWLLYHPKLDIWIPYSLVFSQEGKTKDGKNAGFDNEPVSLDYYYEVYANKKYNPAKQ